MGLRRGTFEGTGRWFVAVELAGCLRPKGDSGTHSQQTAYLCGNGQTLGRRVYPAKTSISLGRQDLSKNGWSGL
jgi:hypothetical protein